LELKKQVEEKKNILDLLKCFAFQKFNATYLSVLYFEIKCLLPLSSAGMLADGSKRRKKVNKMIGNKFPCMAESKNNKTYMHQVNRH
jgi:hypothetical protein